MKLKQLFADDNAVSPVIGVILMVAITVILAAVIGTFVLGLGDQLQQTSPTTNFNFDYANQNPDTLTISHDGGDSVTASQVSLVISGATDSNDDGSYTWSEAGGSTGDITAGDRVSIDGSNVGNADSSINFDGATVRVTWTSETGDSSATLAKWSGPDA